MLQVRSETNHGAQLKSTSTGPVLELRGGGKREEEERRGRKGKGGEGGKGGT